MSARIMLTVASTRCAQIPKARSLAAVVQMDNGVTELEAVVQFHVMKACSFRMRTLQVSKRVRQFSMGSVSSHATRVSLPVLNPTSARPTGSSVVALASLMNVHRVEPLLTLIDTPVDHVRAQLVTLAITNVTILTQDQVSSYASRMVNGLLASV